jgi:F-type H+-transporting ATPase subunit epsilon
MTYLRYANISADLLRNVLKEPFKKKALLRSEIFYRFSPWVNGKQGPQTFIDVKDGMPKEAPKASS